MTEFKPEDPNSPLKNPDYQHTLILLGEQQLFAVHMTQYHTEWHKYQAIFKISLPDSIYRQYLALRAKNPKDTFVICNAKDNEKAQPGEIREFTVPDLGSGMVTRFTANIFQGLRPFTPETAAADPHFFPWSKKYAKAAIGEFEVSVDRVVYYSPFDHLKVLPSYATYLLFGDSKSGETHMTNLQTARIATKLLEPQVFGPDYDHIMSLKQRPEWLQYDAMLEAGIPVTTPNIRLTDPDSGTATIPAAQPFAEGEEIEVMYRGIRPLRSVIAGPSYLFCTAVANSPDFFAEPAADSGIHTKLPRVTPVCDFSVMPEHYWA